jgi:dienelactone hydrolase
MLPLLLLAMTPAADPPADTTKADEAIHKYLAAEVKRLSERFMDGAKTNAEWEAKRPKLKEQFLDMLGLWPLPEKTPLKATVTGTLDRGDVTIEKLHFQSKPGLYVTANLYKPKANPARQGGGGAAKLPAILYVCGHSNKGRDGNKTAFQDHGMWFASNGYVCLIVDTLQLGEVAGKHHGTYNLGRFWWQDRGYTPAGVECWNGIRAIDYLLSRADVDPDRIGVTGISGGGASTVWIAAADDRVKVAVPVSGMSDLESYVTNKVINGHCDCMFFINTYQWEWTTALALFAPKPLLFANSDHDTIFPMDGNRRIIERLRKCYTMLGKPENVDEYVSKGGHDYRPDLRVAIFGFLNKHLKNDAGPVKDANFPKIDGKDLRVFPEDKDLPKDQINDRVDEVFVPKAYVKLPTADGFKEWKAGLAKKLRGTSFRALPEKITTAKLIRERMEDGIREMSSDEGVEFRMAVDFSVVGDAYFTFVVANPNEGREAGKYWGEVERYRKDTPFWGLVWPRGGLDLRWSTKNPPNTVERSFALLGQTADTGRVRDVAALLADLGKLRKKQDDGTPPLKIRVTGRGQAGILAVYAAVLYPGRIDEVVILDPPATHRDGPHFLNVERVLDLPTALGLLAPDVKLTLINAMDPAFDKTAAIYKLAGAADKFERK